MRCSMYRYFFSLCLIFCVCLTLQAQEEEQPNDSIKKRVELNFLRIDLDIAPVVTTFLNKGEIYSFEAGLQTAINNRFYPIVELGFAGANKTSMSDIHYKTNGLFYRAGMDFNLLKNKNENPKYQNFFFAGARLGYSYFAYDMGNINFVDNFWDYNISQDQHLTASKLWVELAAGVRVEMFKNFYMGWSVRIKNLLTKGKDGELKPWYIPGFGTEQDGSIWSFNYMVGYQILTNK